jgi:hypothetical protein
MECSCVRCGLRALTQTQLVERVSPPSPPRVPPLAHPLQGLASLAEALALVQQQQQPQQPSPALWEAIAPITATDRGDLDLAAALGLTGGALVGGAAHAPHAALAAAAAALLPPAGPSLDLAALTAQLAEPSTGGFAEGFDFPYGNGFGFEVAAASAAGSSLAPPDSRSRGPYEPSPASLYSSQAAQAAAAASRTAPGTGSGFKRGREGSTPLAAAALPAAADPALARLQVEPPGRAELRCVLLARARTISSFSRKQCALAVSCVVLSTSAKAVPRQASAPTAASRCLRRSSLAGPQAPAARPGARCGRRRRGPASRRRLEGRLLLAGMNKTLCSKWLYKAM